MGAPISGVMAEAVLQRLEKAALAEYQPKMWLRYVDDTFVIIDREKKDDFFRILQDMFPAICVTVEEEKKPLHDILVGRGDDGNLETSVFREPGNIDRKLQFNNNHPKSTKVGCIRALFERIEDLCSTPKAKVEERKLLLRMFQASRYSIVFLSHHPDQRLKPATSREEVTRW